MPKLIDLTGQRFNRLLILDRIKHKYQDEAYWKCLCDCGNITIVSSKKLRVGHTKSCGCRSIETRFQKSLTPNVSEFLIYGIWKAMRFRCSNPNDPAYKYYGGRGISVCKRWLKFKNFHMDMGDPLKGLTLDRIDNDGNYSPNNCRWATRKEQIHNSGVVKLSESIVLAIRRTKRSAENIKYLALKYSVTRCTIYDVLNERTWT